MTVTMFVGYPTGSNFDMDYYLNKHLPTVGSVWKPFGMGASRVTIATDSKGPYLALAQIEWPSMEAAQKAQTETPPEVHKKMLDDIKNYTDIQPTIWFMENKDIGS
ncbi:uncharacterized protein F4822DRAFT_95791 [Hypoxylon trugodes]|uniref:uncharacterized protein n=1 Tax=Hypoxylon trugodes TaxID=326681 RepID=UPI00218E6FC3|nr:uncharacterized protein F4822DRAFT_95791 [Hypoxylon trugodes]KAI1382748.1 hypothetical protein F4822DRAFT_95791 [Hypoxylon trugodes]